MGLMGSSIDFLHSWIYHIGLLTYCGYVTMQESGGSGHMLKKQLMEAAQPLAEQSFNIVSFFAVFLVLQAAV